MWSERAHSTSLPRSVQGEGCVRGGDLDWTEDSEGFSVGNNFSKINSVELKAQKAERVLV